MYFNVAQSYLTVVILLAFQPKYFSSLKKAILFDKK